MAERSFMWPTGSGQPGDNAEIAEDLWQILLRAWLNRSTTHEAVFRHYGSALHATDSGGATPTVTVGAGVGVANGAVYVNDGNLTFGFGASYAEAKRIPVRASTTRHRIVMRYDGVGNTVRLVVKANASGITSDPVLSRNNNTYEYPVWSMLVRPDNSLDLTDQRAYLFTHEQEVADGSITELKLRDGAVSLAKASDDFVADIATNGINRQVSLTRAHFTALTTKNARTRYFVRES